MFISSGLFYRRDYSTVREELSRYDTALVEKPELLVLTKADLVSESDAAQAQARAKLLNVKTLIISVRDPASVRDCAMRMEEFIRLNARSPVVA